jgi:hypothetical protein
MSCLSGLRTGSLLTLEPQPRGGSRGGRSTPRRRGGGGGGGGGQDYPRDGIRKVLHSCYRRSAGARLCAAQLTWCRWLSFPPIPTGGCWNDWQRQPDPDRVAIDYAGEGNRMMSAS